MCGADLENASGDDAAAVRKGDAIAVVDKSSLPRLCLVEEEADNNNKSKNKRNNNNKNKNNKHRDKYDQHDALFDSHHGGDYVVDDSNLPITCTTTTTTTTSTGDDGGETKSDDRTTRNANSQERDQQIWNIRDGSSKIIAIITFLLFVFFIGSLVVVPTIRNMSRTRRHDIASSTGATADRKDYGDDGNEWVPRCPEPIPGGDQDGDGEDDGVMMNEQQRQTPTTNNMTSDLTSKSKIDTELLFIAATTREKIENNNNSAVVGNSDASFSTSVIADAATATYSATKKKKPTVDNMNNMQPCPSLLQQEQERQRQNRRRGKLRNFGPNVMKPYPSCLDLQHDIENVLFDIAETYIEHQMLRSNTWCFTNHVPVSSSSSDRFDGSILNKGSVGGGGRGEDSYGTNNQMDGVDEADLVKSDGTLVFVSYGTDVVMMHVYSGNVLQRIVIPPPVIVGEEHLYKSKNNNNSTNTNDKRNVTDSRTSVDDNIIDNIESKPKIAAGGGVAAVGAALSKTWFPPMSIPERTIEGLLLDSNYQRLAVITHYPDYSYSTYYGCPRCGRPWGISGGLGGGGGGDSEWKDEWWNAVGGGTTTAFIYAYHLDTRNDYGGNNNISSNSYSYSYDDLESTTPLRDVFRKSNKNTTLSSSFFSSSTFKFLGSHDIPGRYISARFIHGKVHIVTSSSIDTYQFKDIFDRCHPDFTTNLMDQDEDDHNNKSYRDLALDKMERTVSNYAHRIVQQLQIMEKEEEGECSHIVRISSMTSGDDIDDYDDDQMNTKQRLDVLYRGSGPIQSFVRITSFSMSTENARSNTSTSTDTNANTTTTGEGTTTTARFVPSNITTAGAFLPTYKAEVYANHEFFILAGRGYSRQHDNSVENGRITYSQYTHLLSFHIHNNDTSGDVHVKQNAVGQVKGYLLNQFSMDVHEDILRVATTNRAKWGMDNKTGIPQWTQILESSSQVVKLQLYHPSKRRGEGEKGGGGGEKREIGIMKHLGTLANLGNTERIYSCRFMKDRAYIVTFQMKDPLYAIDLQPDTPVILGQLEITGFSNYIHPIANDQYLLTIGQEADPKTGRRIGMKMSLFDISNPKRPHEVTKYVIDAKRKDHMHERSDDDHDDDDVLVSSYSSTLASYDHHAFRYLPKSQKLILPVSIKNIGRRRGTSDDFDGFIVYKILLSRGIIQGAGRITHANNEMIQNFCFGQRASLTPRSMVFDGNLLMTFKGHSIEMRLLDSMNVVEDNDDDAEEVFWTVQLDAGRRRKDKKKTDKDMNNYDGCYNYFA